MNQTLARLPPDLVSALWTGLVGETGRRINYNVSASEQATDKVRYSDWSYPKRPPEGKRLGVGCGWNRERHVGEAGTNAGVKLQGSLRQRVRTVDFICPQGRQGMRKALRVLLGGPDLKEMIVGSLIGYVTDIQCAARTW